MFEVVTRHFLACCSANAKGSETVMRVDVAGETFSTSGLVIAELNYLEVYKYDQWKAKTLPDFRGEARAGAHATTPSRARVHAEGQVLTPTALTLEESHTNPPPLLSENELLKLMDRHGIGESSRSMRGGGGVTCTGTKATSHEHIKTIVDRSYVFMDPAQQNRWEWSREHGGRGRGGE